MSRKGNLEKIKQIFAFVHHENITEEEMGIEINRQEALDNSNLTFRKKPRFVDTISGNYYWSPLMEATVGGHDQVCNYLIKVQQADLEVRDDEQKTALMLAVIWNRLEVLKVLIDNNANIKAQDRDGRHAPYEAARMEYLDALKMLVAKDRSVIDLKVPNGETPLIAAARYRNLDVVRYLVGQNANVNSQDNTRSSALRYLSDSGNRSTIVRNTSPDLVRLLVNQNANVNLRDYNGETALQRASDPEIIKILKCNGAK